MDMTNTPGPPTLPLRQYELPSFTIPPYISPPQTAEVKRDGESKDLFKSALGEGTSEELFPTLLNLNDLENDNALQRPLTLKEITMMQMMCEITEKPMWHEKIFDGTLSDQWKQEAFAAPGLNISQEMKDWCIEELRYKAALPAFKKFGAISVYDADVVKSDSLIPLDVKEALKEAVKPLENVPEGDRDWNPGTNGQVLNLVHPSLFPLVYGKSKILPDSVTTLEDAIQKSGEGIQVPLLQQDGFSRKFQWLPCDVDISGDRARITSYINNLHPQQRPELYSAIEEVLTHVIPLWNITLTPLETFRCGLRRLPIKRPRSVFPPGSQESHGDSGELKPEQLVDLKRHFRDRGLQVIVKLANIHLTPEKPSYPGGIWHVEGHMNERICASAIYYYDNDNVTASSLAFRQVVNTHRIKDLNEDQRDPDTDWLEDTFGLQEHGTIFQELGSVKTVEGRVITFPNILQHKVHPFQLVDPTLPGHRKILAIFLVDPHIRIISTANVPSQRRDWWEKHSDSADEDKVVGQAEEFPIGIEEAKGLREELIKEREEVAIPRWTYRSPCGKSKENSNLRTRLLD